MSEQALLAQLHDINEFIPTAWWQKPWPYLVALGTLCLAATIFLFVRWRQRVRNRPLTLTERTLQQLHALAKQDNATLFYQTLTDIIKTYVQDRYGVMIRPQTDQELLRTLDSLSVPIEVAQTLAAIMDNITEVKFAHRSVDRERMTRDLQRVQQLVHATIPEEK
jgi:hypothetical protein